MHEQQLVVFITKKSKSRKVLKNEVSFAQEYFQNKKAHLDYFVKTMTKTWTFVACCLICEKKRCFLNVRIQERKMFDEMRTKCGSDPLFFAAASNNFNNLGADSQLEHPDENLIPDSNDYSDSESIISRTNSEISAPDSNAYSDSESIISRTNSEISAITDLGPGNCPQPVCPN